MVSRCGSDRESRVGMTDPRPCATAKLLELAARDHVDVQFRVITTKRGDFDSIVMIEPASGRCEVATKSVSHNDRASDAHEELSMVLLCKWYGQ